MKYRNFFKRYLSRPYVPNKRVSCVALLYPDITFSLLCPIALCICI